MTKNPAIVGVIMGSDSDLPTMRAAVETLREFGVPCEVRIISAHRTPDEMISYGREAAGRGLLAVIAGAGGAAHLPGMIAAVTPLPVVGVPVSITQLAGIDALLSIVQMPAGVPVATVAIGGARNAALLVIRMLGMRDTGLRAKMESFQAQAAAKVRAADERVHQEFDL